MTGDDATFLTAFETCALPLAAWDHAAHIRMAWLYLEAQPYAEALARIRSGIQRYNLAQGNPVGYHETITVAFVRVIAHRRWACDPGHAWPAFAAAHLACLRDMRAALGVHYSPELLASAPARAAWVAPDRRPLPAGGDIRPVALADAAAVAAVYAPFVLASPASFELTPPDAAEFDQRIAAVVGAFPWLVFESGGQIVGYAYASAHRARAAYAWSADVSVYVAGSAHGQGVGRALYGQLLPRVAALGYVNAFAGITLPNAASERLHAAFGFTPIGIYRQVGFKLGAWHDAGWYQKVLASAPAAPAPPRRP